MVEIEINPAAVEEDARRLRSLATPARMLILADLAKAPRTMLEIHQVLKKRGLHDYPESTYKALEVLCTAGLLRKTYDASRKRLTYEIPSIE